MDITQQLALIQKKLKYEQYRLTSHAELERGLDRITIQELEDALLSDKAEIIESYPDDPRGRSCLVLGYTKNEIPLHLVCGLRSDELIIITVYRPDPQQWINWRERRKTKR